jgi:hypothetical protein
VQRDWTRPSVTDWEVCLVMPENSRDERGAPGDACHAADDE